MRNFYGAYFCIAMTGQVISKLEDRLGIESIFALPSPYCIADSIETGAEM